ncbi:MAG: 4a-hydroxytetrahydrobiopterin dehydratase [Chromatiales bacterium]|nr:4a-hydroxytetrahydrobiopterin dehydratase [Chromatiales bacterium]
MTSAEELGSRRCKPCEGGVPPLSADEAQRLKSALHGDWRISADGKALERNCEFTGYYRTMAFVNAVAWIAHVEAHHPDLEVSYRRCVVRWSTHAVDGLTENDFICAAKVDRLMAEA